MPVLRDFVNFGGCAVEQGCFKGAGCRGWDGVPFCGADWMGVVWMGGLIWQVERCDVIEISRTCYSCCDVGEPGSEMRAL
jgi:hypothetical protein